MLDTRCGFEPGTAVCESKRPKGQGRHPSAQPPPSAPSGLGGGTIHPNCRGAKGAHRHDGAWPVGSPGMMPDDLAPEAVPKTLALLLHQRSPSELRKRQPSQASFHCHPDRTHDSGLTVLGRPQVMDPCLTVGPVGVGCTEE